MVMTVLSVIALAVGLGSAVAMQPHEDPNLVGDEYCGEDVSYLAAPDVEAKPNWAKLVKDE